MRADVARAYVGLSRRAIELPQEPIGGGGVELLPKCPEQSRYERLDRRPPLHAFTSGLTRFSGVPPVSAATRLRAAVIAMASRVARVELAM